MRGNILTFDLSMILHALLAVSMPNILVTRRMFGIEVASRSSIHAIFTKGSKVR